MSTGDGSTAYNFASTAVYRDPSAWYHIVIVTNTTSATTTQTGTTTDRQQMWVNGVQLSAFSTNQVPTQNFSGVINSTNAHYIGQDGGSANYLDGYLAEVNFVDGQALTPSSFGTYDTNGVWQPIKYSGTYGTNGFHLTFGNTTSTTTLGYDTSGNSNNWTTNNISLTAGSTYDSMTDSPTVSSASVANYATLNPLNKAASLTLSNANLSVPQQTISGTNYGASGSLGFSSGKWYFEVQINANAAGNNDSSVGICKITDAITTTVTSTTGMVGFLLSIANGGSINYGTTTAVTGLTGAATNLVQVAVDVTNGKIWFGADGTWANGGNPSAGTNATYSSGISGYTWVPAIYYWGAGTFNRSINANFGQQPFTYTPPTGFNALNTYNLPTPTIANGAQYMAATLYTGTGATQTISDGGNNTIGTTFQPDLVWIKSRSAATNNNLFDVLRGTTAYLSSNSTSAEATNANTLTAFGSTGFTVGSDASAIGVNVNAATYVGWQWKANGAGVSNTNGSITSTVSANTTAGFSIVAYTGTGANATVGHGLGVAPSMIITKVRSISGPDWSVYHSALGATQYLLLDTTAAAASSVNFWNNTAPTSSVFSVGIGGGTNNSGNTMIAYCWAAVPGYSAFGSYTGNGSTDGPFVYTGFRPRYVFVKETVTVSNWNQWDSSRNPANLTNLLLRPNSSGAESASGSTDIQVDFLANGFKIRGSSGDFNTNGELIIYAAFAENPLNYSRAR